MKFTELWRLSRTVYNEISFQSIFALRVGSSLPQKDHDIKQLVRNAQVNTLISKVITTIFIGTFGFTVFMPIAFGIKAEAPKELVVAGGVTAFLAVLLFLIALMGLQVTTSFVSSKIVDVLSALPLSKREISLIIFLCFLKIFDIPLLAALVIFPIVYSHFTGSILAGLASFISIGIAEIFALALTIGLAVFFYSKILRGGRRSRWSTFLRFIFLVVWVIPTFGAYFVINFATQITMVFASITQTFSTIHSVALIYPFSFGFLASYSAFPDKINYSVLSFSIIACIGYSVFAAYCLKFILHSIRQIGCEVGGVVTSAREIVKDTIIHPYAPWFGVIRKDLRIASRSPSYASLFLLPAIQTALLVFSFPFSELELNSIVGMLLGVSLVTILLPPLLLSIEGLAYGYMRSLPLNKKTLIFAKTLTTIVTYAFSLVVLFTVAMLVKKNFSLVLTFGIINSLAVAAASMLELSFFIRKLWKEGSVLGNIYTRLGTFILIVIPGFVMVLIPLIAATTVYFLGSPLVLPIFSIIATLEFTAMLIVILHE